MRCIDADELLKQPLDMANYPSNFVRVAPTLDVVLRSDIKTADLIRRQDIIELIEKIIPESALELGYLYQIREYIKQMPLVDLRGEHE